MVPPLRERTGDIELLSRHILNKIALTDSAQTLKLGQDAISALQDYMFPGNVRELENTLERATALCEGNVIQPEDLQLPDTMETVETETSPQLEDYLDNTEKTAIMKALEKTRYNKTAAAKLLGISFRQLRYRLKKLDID